MSARASALRTALREGRTPFLRRRRALALLCAAGLLDATVIALRQLGAIGPLPDPPGPFDSDAVVTSPPAYALGAPDAALGALAHATALALCGAGVTAEGRPAGRGWSWLLAAAVGGAAAGTWAYNAVMLRRPARLCPYCLLAGGLSLGAAALVVGELRAGRASPGSPH